MPTQGTTGQAYTRAHAHVLASPPSPSQALSTRPDLAPGVYLDELAVLQV